MKKMYNDLELNYQNLQKYSITMNSTENIEIKWLYDFLALKEHKNFSVAALSRHITQPAFSRRIKALENWVGVPLFDRATYPIELTEHGEKFIYYVDKLLNEIRTVKADFSMYAPRNVNMVRIDCLHSFAVNLLPKLLNKYPNYFTGIEISFNPSICDLDNQFQSLLENTSDFLFTYDTPKVCSERLLENKLEVTRITSELVLPVISPKLLEKISDMETIPFLSFSKQTFLYTLVHPLTEACQSKLNIVFSSTLSGTLVEMAILGRGIAWLPWHAVEDAIKLGDLVPAFSEDKNLTTTLDIVCYRAKHNKSNVVNQFYNSLMQIYQQ